MNSLSWMIYAADVVGGFKAITVAATILGIGGGAISTIIGTVPWHEWSWDKPDTIARKETARTNFRYYGKRLVAVGLISSLFAVAIPTSSAIYLIAASEAGETIVKSPEAKEVFDDLKTIIKSKLKEQLPKA